MSLFNLLYQLKEKKIRLFLEEGQLKVDAPKGAMTPELLAQIRRCKGELIEHLSAPSSDGFAIESIERTSTLPLSFSQQRLWFIDQLEEDQSAYHLAETIWLTGEVSYSALSDAFARVISRHEILRTVYRDIDGAVEQVILDDVLFMLDYTNLSGQPESQSNSALQSIVDQVGSDRFNLASDLMLRAHLVQFTDDKYALSFCVHHIASDAWSMDLLLSEVADFYNGLMAGQTLTDESLPVQYADYAIWQRQQLSGQQLERHLDYWTGLLKGLPQVHRLPLDATRPSIQSYRGDVVKCRLEAELVEKLNDLAGQTRTTLFMILHAAFSGLLARHSGETDIVIGTTIANREQAAVEPLIGFFVNTLLLRSDLSNQPSFRQLLEQSRHRILDAFEHQQMPFDVLVDELQPERSLSYNPLFQVMLSLNDTVKDADQALDGLVLDSYEQGESVAQFDLSLDMVTDEDGMDLHWTYATDLFEASTIERMAQHFEALLQTLVADPEVQLSRIPLLSKPELTQQLQQYSGASRVYPGAVTVHERFAAIAEQMPEAIAAVHNGERLSYGALQARVNQVAHRLVARGVGPNTLVALHCPRGLDFLVGVLGTLSAGGAYVPLDPNNPADRLSYMVEHAQASVVLTHTSLAGQLDYPQDSIALALDDASLWADQPVEHPDVVVGGDDLAYMIFTSGSTGRPKGALVHHAGALNHIDAEFELLDASDAQGLQPLTFLQSAASSSDVSVWQFLAPVVSGGTTVILDDQSDVPNLVRTLQQERVQLIQTAPVVLQVLVDYLEQQAEQGGEFALPDLRWLMTIAEACPVPLINRWFALNPEIPIMNGFGPSEASDDITYHILREPLSADTLSVPIGRPIANLTMYVVDEQLQLQPHGVVGELCVSGVGVGPGYWQDEARTNAVFVANPYAGQPGVHGERLYRTGDLGRWLPDGTLEFLGRKDNQVKIRGFRVELGEVEAALAKVDGTADVAVLVQPGPTGDARLAAYVVPSDGVTLTAEQIRTALQAHLPEYMLPSSVTFLERMPLNAADKIDRAKLPAPDWSQSQVAYRAPEGELEQTLAEIWRDVLGVEQVGRDDHFFLLGGHSLLAVQLVARIKREMQVNIAIRDLFEQPVLHTLATLVSSASKTEEALPPITAVDRSEPLPLSWSQQRLWFINQLDQNASETYHLPNAIQLFGQLHKDALQKTLDTIIERHEILRTIFVNQDGTPMQQVLSDQTFNLTWVNLSNETPERQQSLLDDHAEQEEHSQFNLNTGPLIRGRLVSLSETEHHLLVTMHHIVSDDLSENILVDEFSQLYNAYKRGEENPLAPLKIQYADYAVWQRKTLSGDVLESHLSYWKKRLDNLPLVHSLPLDFPRPAEQSYRGESIDFTLGQELTQAIKQIAGQSSTSNFIVLNAAFAYLLGRFSGQTDIVVGSPIANREQVEVEPLIGFFVNTLLSRTDLSGQPSFHELLQHCRNNSLEDYAHQQVPFDLLVEELQPERSLSFNPLFQVMLSLETQGGELILDDAELVEDDDLSGVQLIADSDETRQKQIAQFDLMLDVSEDDGCFSFSWKFATDLFKRSTVMNMAEQFVRLLQQVTQHPEQPLHTLNLMTRDERHNLLTTFNNSAQPELFTQTWAEHFVRQAQTTPDTISVVAAQGELTYQQLLTQSTQRAQQLLASGLRPGDLVAVLDHRDLDLMVTVVALMRTGLVYVPLDPTHPSQRWLDILQEAEPVRVVVGASLAMEQRWLSRKWNKASVLSMSALDEVKVDDSSALPSPAITDLAYVIYTSGSTGRPKGVMIEHRGMINNMLSKVEPLGLSEDDVIAQAASQCFDISVWQFLTAPLLGAKVCILDNDTARDPSALLTALTEQGVTVWEPVPSVMQAALLTSQPLPSLRWVLPTGEALSKDLVQRWFETYPYIPLMNAYGPAECSDDVAFEPIHGPVERVLIGRPVANARLHVVDSHQQLVPVGVVGELAISGPVVGRGYLNRDDLTAEVFIDNPFVQDDLDQRLYLTGDLVRRLDDGRLVYVGRKDFQVKIRGFRIELGEIENSLCEHDDVREALVLAHSNEQGDASLVAYYVTDHEQTTPLVKPADGKTFLKSKLPDYMVPTVFIALETFPLSANGKIDRNKLPTPDFSKLQTEDYVEPINSTEWLLAATWQNLLNIERVGRHDDFFNLGGHSLLIMRLVEALRVEGYQLSARDVFERPVLNELATCLALTDQSTQFSAPENLIPNDCEHITPEMLQLVTLSQQQIDDIAEQVDGGYQNIQDIYPLAPLQQGILFHHLLNDSGDVYVTPMILSFENRHYLDAFLQALQKVIQRHDILRSSIAWRGLETAVQVVHRAVTLPVIEYTLDNDSDDLAQLNQRIGREDLAIDVERAPLLQSEVAFKPDSEKCYLVLKEHHLIGDHVTMELLVQEVQSFLLNDSDSLLPPVQYREFVAHTQAKQDRHDSQLFFTELLAGIDEPTAPFGLLDVYGDGAFAEKANISLNTDVSARLISLTKSMNVSPASVFHLAWARVLGACSNRDDVVFGTVMSGRLQGVVGADRMLGMFINMLPFRLDLTEESPSSALKVAHEQLVALVDYEQSPLAEVQRCCDIEPGAPLFTSILNYRHDDDGEGEQEAAWQGIELVSDDDPTNYPVEISIDFTGRDFALEVFADQRIGANLLADYMQRTVSEIVCALESDHTHSVLALPLISKAEQTQQLQQYSGASRVYPGAVTVHERFAAIAEQMPEAIAAVHNGERLSYGALKARVNQVAHRLVARGVGPNTLVALHCPRGLDFLVGVLGTLSAGGAYVPLDPNNPADRLSYMVEHAQASVVLTHTSLAGQLDYPQDSIALALDDASLWADQPVEHPDVVVGGDDLAYMIFTSGSTGRPKGALVHHAGALNHIDAEFELLDASDAQGLQPLTFLQSAASSSDVSVWQFLAPVVSGGTTVILDDQSDVPNLVRTLQQERVQLIQTAPVVLQVLVDYLEQQAEQGGEFALPDLRWLMTIAEACPVPLINRWFALNPEIPIMNGFGPSEASDDITYHILREPLSADTLSVPIGRPIANLTMYVVDEQLQLQPHGVVGELCVSGVGVGPGYWQDEARTNAVFVANPYAGQPGVHGERLYRTGDLGRWLPDGTLEFLGRKDNQVKIRGFRVELGEVEAALAKVDGTADVAVLVQPGPTGDARLAAYVVPSDGVTLTAEQIRTALQAHLPEYMLPSSVTFLERMPLNAADKIDRAKLPAPDWSQSQVAYRAPEGELEQTLAEIWRDVLGVEQVGRDDHFFLLGGHSLLAVQLVARVQQQLQRALALRDVFDRPELQRMAALLAEGDHTEVVAITPVGRTQPIPLSWSQQRLWFIDQLDAQASEAYHMANALQLSGELNIAALQQALTTIVDRHEVLRTSYQAPTGEPVQVINPHAQFPLTISDLSTLTATEQTARLDQLTAECAQAPFDLAQGPVIRGQLVRLSEREHRLLITTHHIASDGWSENLFIDELSALYDAFAQGDANPLAPLPIQYADYAAWQRTALSAERLSEQLAYWQQHLDGAPSLLELPLDHARPAEQSFAGDTVDFQLPTELSDGLRSLAQAHGLTLNMVLYSAWAVLLCRLSGQNDVVIGSPVANRPHAALEPLLGFFVNTVALRTELRDDPSVAALLQRVKATWLDGVAHQDVPFEQLVDAVQPNRSLSHSPIFQVMFAMDNTGREDQALELDGLQIQPAQQHEQTTVCDLTLSVEDDEEGIGASLEFATALFSRATIERWAGYYTNLLTAWLVDTDQAISQSPILPAVEQQRVLQDFNPHRHDPSIDTPLVRLFEQQVQAAPTAIAVIDGEQRVSYTELNQRAEQLAQSLAEQHADRVEPGATVALLMPRGQAQIIGQLALLKLAVTAVPIDPAFPDERRAYLLADSQAGLILTTVPEQAEQVEQTQKANTENTETGTIPVIDVTTLAFTDEAVVSPLNRDVQAYIDSVPMTLMYTSGSTGQPKGVMAPQRGATRIARDNGYAAITSDDTLVHCSNPAFDGATFEVWGALLNGAKTVIVPHDTLLNVDAFIDLLTQHQVSFFFLTVGLFNQYADAFIAQRTLVNMKAVFVGGEALDPGIMQRVREQAGPQQLCNIYGPTETTTFATYHPIERAYTRSIPIGRPIGQTTVYLLDALQQPVPEGVCGELYIGGSGVAMGYLNRPELTAERFIADPFSDTPNARLYRTGDLGRWVEDGAIEFLGRNDDQVKLRGFRIELGEIEARLKQQPAIHEVAVLVLEASPGDKRLVAYVSPQNGQLDSLNPQDIQHELRRTLPEYMVPQAIVSLEQFPLNSSGKIDRKRLPAPDASAFQQRDYVAPSNETERQLAELWQQLLPVEQVGRHDHFFELGGHSLLAVQLVSRVHSDLGDTLVLRDVFDAPELHRLAERLTNQTQTETALDTIEPADRSGPIPLSWSQQRLWFIAQLDAQASEAYHIPGALEWHGELNRTALQQALDRILARHEVLRTVFAEQNGQPVQVIQPAQPFALRTVDLRHSVDLDHDLQAQAEAEESRAFDLSQGPLIRATLVQTAEQHHVLLVTLHHIISDGWSLGVFSSELNALYIAFASGHADPLAPLAIQYADYAVWQRQTLAGERLQSQLTYWQQQLADIPQVHNLPLDFPRPVEQSYQGGSHESRLSPTLSDGLKTLARAHDATLFMTLQAAFAGLLGRYSGETDIVMGTTIANREQAGVEGLMGLFVNTLVLRSDLSEVQNFAGLLSQSKERLLGAYAHQQVPFDALVEVLQPERSLSYNPVFQVMLSFENMEDAGDIELVDDVSSDEIDEQTMWQSSDLEQSDSVAQFDVMLSVTEEDDGELALSWQYATDLFKLSTIERMAESFTALVQAVVTNAQQPLHDINLLDITEENRQLCDWNKTQQPELFRQTWADHFVCKAKATPDQVALIAAQGELTYQQLLIQSQTRAEQLLASGLQPGDRVAVLDHRDLDLMVTVVALMRTGLVYVPLDPTHPSQRWLDIVQEAEPKRLLVGSALAVELRWLARKWDRASVLSISQITEVPAAVEPIELPTPALTDLAYVIYTSGSTGRPKGVMIEHRGMINNMLSKVEPLGLSEDDVIAQTASQCFDISVWQFLTAPLLGAKVCILDNDTVRDPSALLTALTEQGVTVWEPVPSVMQAALLTSQPLPSLRWVLPTGEALSKDLVQRWFETYPNIPLMNAYGPAECSDDVAFEPIHGPVERVLIGRPVANARLHVVDAHRQLVPVGVVGELAISGPVVGRGYLNRDDLTAEVFIDNPFAQDDLDQRLYLTGDLVRRLDDGRLEYVGRKDFQVKIRGFRIELGEIESSLCEHDDVREALVVAHTNEQGEASLVAYAVTDSAATDLKTHLKARLPAYMVPSFILPLSAFPLTANGKIDRTKLPEPDASALSQTIFEAPEDETEQLLADIWQDLLGIERVGRFDNFFDLGGHSLLATQVLVRLREALDIEVPIVALFQHTQLNELATHLIDVQLSQFSDDDIAQLSEELDELTDDEVQTLLAMEEE